MYLANECFFWMFMVVICVLHLWTTVLPSQLHGVSRQSFSFTVVHTAFTLHQSTEEKKKKKRFFTNDSHIHSANTQLKIE